MFFIPYDEWMAKTRSRLRARSDALKELDKAILGAEQCSADDAAVMAWFGAGIEYMKPEAKEAMEIEKANRALNVEIVRKAFNAWTTEQSRKGQDWRNSVRNESGAVKLLAEQIAYWTSRYQDKGMQAALQTLIEERNKSIPVLFADCVVVVYSDAFTKKDDRMAKGQAAEAAIDSYKLSRIGRPPTPSSGHSVSFLSSISGKIDGMVRDAFGTAAPVWDRAEGGIGTILEYAIHAIKEEIAALAPGVGLGVASASAVFHTVKLIMQSVAADQILTLSNQLEEGDSRAALRSVREWELRAIAERTAKVARAGVNVGMHAAAIASLGVGIPAQLAVSLASAIVALASVIAELGMQYKEKRALTTYLNAGTLDRNIFAQAPLAGAYYLLNTPDSHIALQLVKIGAPGWQADVELLKNSGSLNTAQSEAGNLISAMRYRIVKKDGGRLRERLANSLGYRAKKSINEALR